LFPACPIRPNNQQKELPLEFEIPLNFVFFKVVQIGQGDAFWFDYTEPAFGKGGLWG